MKYIKTNEEYKLSNLQPVKLLMELTSKTIPYGSEELIYDVVQKNCKHKLNKDSFGNLHVSIGNSKILFCAHLDTYSQKVEEVNHILEDNKLKTDETTILGGDNKVGCAVIINMINHDIPGNYYFFIGEEVGRLGSIWLNDQIKEGDFTLALTFDRKFTGSVCTYQRGVKLCNDELASNIISQLDSVTGYSFKEDYFGLSCDTYSFNEKVNNCLNISTGVYDEHKKTEWVDLNFFRAIFNGATKINWKIIEDLSEEKVRDFMDVERLNVKSPVMRGVLDFFIKNGYNPTTVPNFNQTFGIYTKDLYFKLKPKINDYFFVAIKKSGKVKINGLLLSKEDVLKYIKAYKLNLVEFKIDSDTYHTLKIDLIEKNLVFTLWKNSKEVEEIKIDLNFNLVEGDESVYQKVIQIFEDSKLMDFYMFGQRKHRSL